MEAAKLATSIDESDTPPIFEVDVAILTTPVKDPVTARDSVANTSRYHGEL